MTGSLNLPTLIACGAVTALVGGSAFAIGQGAGDGTEIVACYAKKGPEKRELEIAKKGNCPKGTRTVAWNEQGPQGEPGQPGAPGGTGQPGQPGQPGAPGADATNLFAYIADTAATDAVVQYGSGVTSVAEPAANNGDYRLTFGQSLAGCVVQVMSGVGDPIGPGQRSQRTASANLSFGAANEVEVNLADAATGGGGADSSFLVTAFC